MRRSTKLWPNLNSIEKEEITKKRVSIRNKTFKEMLYAFRKIRGLDPASPIDENSLKASQRV